MESDTTFESFSARLRDFISSSNPTKGEAEFNALSPFFGTTPPNTQAKAFSEMALELFGLQFEHNAAYRAICGGKAITPSSLGDWRDIPAVPTAAFKELTMSSIPAPDRIKVFYSSGTTGQLPSRHYHGTGSLAIYEASLWPWLAHHLFPDFEIQGGHRRTGPGLEAAEPDIPRSAAESLGRLAILTPSPSQAPNSSLVHMFETARSNPRWAETVYLGKLTSDGAWNLDSDASVRFLREAETNLKPVTLMGTAFAFVHLLDRLEEGNLTFRLSPGSRALETGGYKGRSRAMPKANLHALLSARLGMLQTYIVSEYGMSELSSQAYDRVIGADSKPRVFTFPPWARVQVVSPETGFEVEDGETGLIKVFDLANVYSVLALQTEDLAIRRGSGFELVGRAALAEPRGCSLMAVN